MTTTNVRLTSLDQHLAVSEWNLDSEEKCFQKYTNVPYLMESLNVFTILISARFYQTPTRN